MHHLFPHRRKVRYFLLKPGHTTSILNILFLSKQTVSARKWYRQCCGSGSPGGRTEPGTMSGSDLELAFVTDGRTRKKECIGPERPRRSD